MCLSWVSGVSSTSPPLPSECRTHREISSTHQEGYVPMLCWFFSLQSCPRCCQNLGFIFSQITFFTLFIKLTPIHRLSSRRIISRQKQTCYFHSSPGSYDFSSDGTESGAGENALQRETIYSYMNEPRSRAAAGPVTDGVFPLFRLAFSRELYYFYIRASPAGKLYRMRRITGK